MFDPFVTHDPRWASDPEVEFVSDSVKLPLAGGAMTLTQPVSFLRYEVAGQLIAFGAAPLHQLYLGVSRGSSPFWYGELYDDATEHRNTVLYNEGSAYSARGNLDRTSLVSLGSFLARIDVLDAPPRLVWHVETSDHTYDVTGAYTEDLHGTELQFYDGAIELQLDYAVLIETR